jgi:hypothetical protein
MANDNASKSKAIRLNCILFWAQLKKVNDMSGKYQVDLTNLSAAAVKALQAAGITVRTRDDKPEMGAYITCKSANPIKAYDDNGVEIDVLIGNGSSAIATVRAYDWSFKNKTGKSASLDRLTVTNLIEAQLDDGDDGDGGEVL